MGERWLLWAVSIRRARRSEALAEARRSSPLTLIWALWQAWLFDWALEGRDAVPTTLRWAEEVSGLAADLGFPLAAVCGKVMRGWCLSVTARAAEGIPLLIEGLGVTDVTGTRMLVPFMHTVIADVHGIAGQSAEGLERLDTAVQLMETTQERWAEAEMHRVRGDLLVRAEQTAAAEESYRRALDTARGQDAKLWEVKGATSLARLWRDQGKRAEARDLLAPVYGSFTEGLDTPVLKEAKALLEQLAL